MKVSSIIRCRNEERWIGYAIQSFLDFFPDGEIIIVDNLSSDDSLEIVNLFDYADIKVLSVENYTPGLALNEAVKQCTGDVVLIQSAHSVIKSANIDELKSILSDNIAVFGNQDPYYLGKKITKRYVWSHFTEEKCINMYSELEGRNFLHNAFCFYRREALVENRFDERLSGKEDRYWANDIVKKGFQYLYDPVNFSCDHHFTQNGNTWKGLG